MENDIGTLSSPEAGKFGIVSGKRSEKPEPVDRFLRLDAEVKELRQLWNETEDRLVELSIAYRHHGHDVDLDAIGTVETSTPEALPSREAVGDTNLTQPSAGEQPTSVEPTIDWLIDQIAPNPGNSPLLNYNKDRLRKLISEEHRQAKLAPDTVTRFELIDHTENGLGRLLTKHNVAVELSYQDDDRTLKVFLRERGENNE